MMNMKISESKLRRIQVEYERKMQRISENNASKFNSGFKLIGVLNMFEIIPDFVIPIFINTQEELLTGFSTENTLRSTGWKVSSLAAAIHSAFHVSFIFPVSKKQVSLTAESP